MAQVLAISSQVARGAIGLSATVPVLQTFGHDVVALPTVLLSNHPGHSRFAGEQVAPALLSRMLEALAANGWLASVDAVLTGYLPSLGHVEVARNALLRVKSANPNAIYFCDPILGDEPKGLYIAAEAAAAIRDHLLPRADVLKMNRFECEWLGERPIASAADVKSVASTRCWPTTIVTSLTGAIEGHLYNLLLEPRETAQLLSVEKRRGVPNGTGDVFAGLYLAHSLRHRSSIDAFARTVAGVGQVIARSDGRDELQLIPCLRSLAE